MRFMSIPAGYLLARSGSKAGEKIHTIKDLFDLAIASFAMYLRVPHLRRAAFARLRWDGQDTPIQESR
jgi:hypothetical protein